MRITPKYLNQQIAYYNGLLKELDFPHFYRNHANGGWQQLDMVFYPSTGVRQIERGTSRDCVEALERHYVTVYKDSTKGVLTIVEHETLDFHTIKNTKLNPFPYTTTSAHTAAKNILSNLNAWRLVYKVNDTQYTITLNDTWA